MFAAPGVARVQAAPDSRNERTEPERDELRPHDVDAERRGGRLTRTHGRQVETRGRPFEIAHEQRDEHEEHDEQVVEGAVADEAAGPWNRDSLAEVVDARGLEIRVLHELREREGGQREVKAAEAKARERREHADRHDDHGAEKDGEEHGNVVVRGELRSDRRRDPGEGDLTQRDHPAVAGYDDVRQECDREREATCDDGEPESVEEFGRDEHAREADRDREQAPPPREVRPDHDLTHGSRERARVDREPLLLQTVVDEEEHEHDDERDARPDAEEDRVRRGSRSAGGSVGTAGSPRTPAAGRSPSSRRTQGSRLCMRATTTAANEPSNSSVNWMIVEPAQSAEEHTGRAGEHGSDHPRHRGHEARVHTVRAGHRARIDGGPHRESVRRQRGAGR